MATIRSLHVAGYTFYNTYLSTIRAENCNLWWEDSILYECCCNFRDLSGLSHVSLGRVSRFTFPRCVSPEVHAGFNTTRQNILLDQLQQKDMHKTTCSGNANVCLPDHPQPQNHPGTERWILRACSQVLILAADQKDAVTGKLNSLCNLDN